jgi:hypothetical protein
VPKAGIIPSLGVEKRHYFQPIIHNNQVIVPGQQNPTM